MVTKSKGFHGSNESTELNHVHISKYLINMANTVTYNTDKLTNLT